MTQDLDIREEGENEIKEVPPYSFGWANTVTPFAWLIFAVLCVVVVLPTLIVPWIEGLTAQQRNSVSKPSWVGSTKSFRYLVGLSQSS